jgi:8-oxo-dGTP diphosphatase
MWDLPGGFCGADEEPEAAVVRELREETGCLVEIVRFLGHVVDEYGDGGDHTLNCVYEARVAEGAPTADDDVAELRWFDVDALPEPEELAFANTLTALRRFARWH